MGRPHPEGHPDYPRMGSFFSVQGGGGSYPALPSPRTNMSAAGFLLEKAGFSVQAREDVLRRTVAETMQSLTALQVIKQNIT